MRSNSSYETDELIRRTVRVSDLLGVDHIVKDKAGAWEGDGTALIMKVAELYEKQYGEPAKFVQTHGGVEIGTILGLAEAAGKPLSAVNFGAKQEGAHTTRERMSVSGMQQAYDWLKFVLVNLD